MNHLSQYAARKRPALLRELQRISNIRAAYSAAPWSTDVATRLMGMEMGKMLRALLTLISYQATGGTRTKDALHLAAIIELLHAAFLVHDDIIDSDRIRRGAPSLFAQYATRVGKRPDADAIGKNLALCAGDVALLHASGLLAHFSTQSSAHAAAAQFIFSHCTETGLGEMEDIALGAGIDPITAERIEQMLIYKTARYSCAMPLGAGALLAGARTPTVRALDRIGEDIGIIFQIRDDELGVFGTTEQLGKPEGSDIREGKETLYKWHLIAAANRPERARLMRIYGSPRLSAADLAYVRHLTISRGVQALIDERLMVRRTRVQRALTKLNLAPRYHTLLVELLEYVTARSY